MNTLNPFDRPTSSLRSVHGWSLPLLAVAVAGGFVLAACGGSSGEPTGTDDDPQPSFDSYEAIKGTWSGPVANGQRWGEVQITKDSAETNDNVGTSAQFEEEGGDLWCRSDLIAFESDPPTYFVNAVQTEVVGCEQRDAPLNFRLKHDPDEGTLKWEWKRQDESNFKTLGTLTRESG